MVGSITPSDEKPDEQRNKEHKTEDKSSKRTISALILMNLKNM